MTREIEAGLDQCCVPGDRRGDGEGIRAVDGEDGLRRIVVGMVPAERAARGRRHRTEVDLRRGAEAERGEGRVGGRGRLVSAAAPPFSAKPSVCRSRPLKII